jgi:preprotein translocase subunit SecG
MITVVLTIHLILAITLVCVVLLQKSEGGALGMGGGGMSGFMSGRSTANLLTRTTAILAALFFVTSILLAYLAASQRAPRSIIDVPASAPQEQPLPNPTAPAAPPVQPAAPSAPLAK